MAPFEWSFSFAGGGWMMVYEFGVAKALQEHKMHDRARFIGVSAGSLASLGLALNADFDATVGSVLDRYLPMVHANLLGPFRMREYLVDAIETHLPLDQLGRLHQTPGIVTVVYTSLSAWVTRRVSTFPTREDLVKTLIASCCATPLVGLPFKLHGEWVADGVLLDNQPVFEDNDQHARPTIQISPSSSAPVQVDIKPSRYVYPWWYVYPPGPEEMRWVYQLGYHDGLQWLRSHGYTQQTHSPSDPGELRWRTSIGAATGYRWVDDAFSRIVAKPAPWWFSALWVILQLELLLCFGSRLLIANRPRRTLAGAALLLINTIGIAVYNDDLVFLAIVLLCIGAVTGIAISIMALQMATTAGKKGGIRVAESSPRRLLSCMLALQTSVVVNAFRCRSLPRGLMRATRQIADDYHDLLWETSLIFRVLDTTFLRE